MGTTAVYVQVYTGDAGTVVVNMHCDRNIGYEKIMEVVFGRTAKWVLRVHSPRVCFCDLPSRLCGQRDVGELGFYLRGGLP